MVRYGCVREVLYGPTEFKSYANDALGANKLDESVRQSTLRVTLTISLEVAQVANMAVLIGRSTVLLAVWIDYHRLLDFFQLTR
jgi:hypothetical protein